MKLIVTDFCGLAESETERALACFPPARKAEIERNRFARDRARSTVAEAAVRLEIMRMLYIPDAEIHIARTETGKPYLEGFRGFCFNLSHSGDYAVCATDALPVGADVELIRPIDHAAIAERWFTREEREDIARSDAPLAAFYRVWTAKESVSKWLGTGISEQWKGLNTAKCGSRETNALAYDVRSFGLRHGAGTLCTLDASCDYALSVCHTPGGDGTTEAIFCRADALLADYLSAHSSTE